MVVPIVPRVLLLLNLLQSRFQSEQDRKTTLPWTGLTGLGWMGEMWSVAAAVVVLETK